MSDKFPELSVDNLKKAVVIGAGTMGHGIAQVLAMADVKVVLTDLDKDQLDKAQSAVGSNLEKGVARQKVTEDAAKNALANLRTSTSFEEESENADLVIEAVPESLSLKQSIFQALAKSTRANAVLATNTSSLSLANIASVLPESDRLRFVGMHFFNPVHIMKLVEVVRHSETGPATVEFAAALAKKMGKTPIVVADSPGFASSRLGVVLGLEAMKMVEEGVASPEDIDTAMKLGYGHPMGPLELTDLVGLDVRLAIAKYLEEIMGAAYKPPAILEDKVKAGHLGKKAGQGFYAWQNGKPER